MAKAANNARSKLCVERINVQLWKTKTNNTEHNSVGCSECPEAQVCFFFCHFPTADSSMNKISEARVSYFILIYVCSCDILEWYLRCLKGETSKSMQKEKGPSKPGQEIKSITLTSNFGIKCFGHTILSLCFWLFSTKHPVIKGRLVVDLFIFSI